MAKLKSCCRKTEKFIVDEVHKIEHLEDFVRKHKDQIEHIIHLVEKIPYVGPYVKAADDFVCMAYRMHSNVFDDIQKALDAVETGKLALEEKEAISLTDSFALKDAKLVLDKGAGTITGSATLVGSLDSGVKAPGDQGKRTICALVSFSVKDDNVSVSGSIQNSFTVPLIKDRNLSLKGANINLTLNKSTKEYNCNIAQKVSISKDGSKLEQDENSKDTIIITFGSEDGGFKHLISELTIGARAPSTFDLVDHIIKLDEFSNDEWFKKAKKMLDLKFTSATFFLRPFLFEGVMEVKVEKDTTVDTIYLIDVIVGSGKNASREMALLSADLSKSIASKEVNGLKLGWVRPLKGKNINLKAGNNSNFELKDIGMNDSAN